MVVVDMESRPIEVGDIVVRAGMNPVKNSAELMHAIVLKIFDNGTLRIHTRGKKAPGNTEPDRVLSITAIHREAER